MLYVGLFFVSLPSVINLKNGLVYDIEQIRIRTLVLYHQSKSNQLNNQTY